MAFFSDLEQHLAVLREAFGGDVDAARRPAAIDGLADDAVIAVLAAATGLVRAGEKVRIAAAGVTAARSARDAGHNGLAQRRGHRSTTSLIKEITGATKAEAAKHVRLGESLRAVAGLDPVEAALDAALTAADPVASPPWDAPLGRALLAGTIGSAQHDAILRGLGGPPAMDDAELWSLAAEQLIAEASERTVEELGRTA